MLTGQVAIVSGGLGDIGLAIARSLSQRGAKVAVGDVREPMSGPFDRYDQVDVRDPAAVSSWYDAVSADLGTPTLIVPNAAIVTLGRWDTITPEDWQRHLDVNLSGSFFMAQEGARRLVKEGRRGRIVFLGSWVADRADPSILPYCVSKAGLRMVMKELALALAPHDILVNEVAPGFVDAGVSAQVYREQAGRREASMARVPIGRLISAEEVALQVAHLCDPVNRHMTGGVVLMDGGNSL